MIDAAGFCCYGVVDAFGVCNGWDASGQIALSLLAAPPSAASAAAVASYLGIDPGRLHASSSASMYAHNSHYTGILESRAIHALLYPWQYTSMHACLCRAVLIISRPEPLSQDCLPAFLLCMSRDRVPHLEVIWSLETRGKIFTPINPLTLL
jgi:hypothetical protein